MFFVLSGFLITTSALDKWKALPNINLCEFYLKRFARIMPLLVALLLVLSILHITEVKGFVINPNSTILLRALFAALTFHVNWLEIQVGYLPGSWDVLWSLSIEEVFYLFFPYHAFFVVKNGILLPFC
jgi:peptidoglycan/LPS O-acetylase OafA/YrhL